MPKPPIAWPDDQSQHWCDDWRAVYTGSGYARNDGPSFIDCKQARGVPRAHRGAYMVWDSGGMVEPDGPGGGHLYDA